MAALGKDVVIFSVEPPGKVDELAVNEVAKETISSGYSSFTPVILNSQIYLLGYDPARDHFGVYESDAASLKPNAAKRAAGKAKDIVNGFMVGDQPYVSVYTASNGVSPSVRASPRP